MWLFLKFFIPSGDASNEINLIFFGDTPDFFIKLIASMEELPVANIGSKTIKVLFEFLRDKKMRQSLVHRLYGMYIQKHLLQFQQIKQTKQVKQTS